MARVLTVSLTVVLLLGVIAAAGWTAGSAQNTSPQATIQAQGTTIANLKATVTARGNKINAQRTQIAEYRTQVADLQGQIPPTMTPTPQLTGKDAYTWLADPRELLTRPGQHMREKWVFCGTVLSIQVAGPGKAFFIGDSDPQGYETIAQVYPSGYSDPFAVGFNGNSSGIYEDSYVCVWGTLVDTFSGTNGFGGTIVNPLFDAEYFELG